MKLITFIFCLLSTATFAKKTESYLAIANKTDHTVSFLNLNTKKEVIVDVGYLPHEVTVNKTHAFISNYGKQHVRSTDTSDLPGNSLTVVSLETFKKTHEISLGPKKCAPHGVFHSLFRPLLYVTCEAREEILVIDTQNFVVKDSIYTQQAGSHMVVVNASDSKAYVTNFWIGTVSVIDLTAKKVIEQIRVGRTVEGIDLGPQGEFLYLTIVEQHKLIKVSTKTNKIVMEAQLEEKTSPIRVLVSKDGDRLYVNNTKSKSLTVFNSETLTKLNEASLEKLPIGIAVANSDRFVYSANMLSQTISVYDVKKEQIVDVISVKSKKPDGIFYFQR